MPQDERNQQFREYFPTLIKVIENIKTRIPKFDSSMSPEKIDSIENELGVKFPASVYQFMRYFGSAYSLITSGNVDTFDDLDAVRYMQEYLADISLDYPEAKDDFPKDIIVISAKDGQSIIYFYKSDLIKYDDPPIYIWSMLNWWNNIGDEVRGRRKLSDKFSLWIDELSNRYLN